MVFVCRFVFVHNHFPHNSVLRKRFSAKRSLSSMFPLSTQFCSTETRDIQSGYHLYRDIFPHNSVLRKPNVAIRKFIPRLILSTQFCSTETGLLSSISSLSIMLSTQFCSTETILLSQRAILGLKLSTQFCSTETQRRLERRQSPEESFHTILFYGNA